jgi:hypothetical protein
MNPLPFNVSEKAPGAMVFGLTEVSTGTGFSSISALFPCFAVSAALVAVTMIVFGVGKFAGAVNNPVASIVPVVGFPPGTVFTDHVTLVFAFPVTADVNSCVAPARTIAVAGVTVTTTAALSGGIVGDPLPRFCSQGQCNPPQAIPTLRSERHRYVSQACPPSMTRSLTRGKQGTTMKYRVLTRADGYELQLNW